MKQLFAVVGLLAMYLMVNATSKPSANVAQAVAEWERAKAYTKEYLDAMPEDGYKLKPTPEIRSFAEQMMHLADANYGFTAAATGKASPLERGAAEKAAATGTKEQVMKTVLDSYDFAINGLKGLTDAQLGETAKFAGRDMTREMIFAKCFEHQTHHRGQTTIYIRLKGIKPPNEKLF
ncbi:DinB family protein [Runella sp.]|uniref:DinB family protein n=1 Tax=Runella sp. TaxID=1960881 RepID=UPI003D0A05AD